MGSNQNRKRALQRINLVFAQINRSEFIHRLTSFRERQLVDAVFFNSNISIPELGEKQSYSLFCHR